jgi:GR25 family glycosyltransferase involved in LPS biosynthesis
VAFTKPKNLTDWFERVYVINRPDRPQRLQEFYENVESTEVADPSKIIVYPAIMGDKTSFPSYFLSGAGAWGCLRSHSNIIENLILEQVNTGVKIKSVLILEDDVKFINNPLFMLHEFMTSVPKNWDQIYLGGQHRVKPQDTSNIRVKRGLSVNRTHAYALNRKVFRMFYCHINNASEYCHKQNHHIDHQLEIAHRKEAWNVYCPPVWLAGQREGYSDVCNKSLEYRDWN